MTEWIVVATKTKVKIFEKKNQELKWLRTLENRKGRRRERAFHSDRPGFSFAKSSANMAPHSLNPHHGHVEVICVKFAHKIVSILKSAHERNLYGKLTVIAAPHLLGILRSQIDGYLEKIQAHTIASGLGQATTAEIMAHIS